MTGDKERKPMIVEEEILNKRSLIKYFLTQKGVLGEKLAPYNRSL